MDKIKEVEQAAVVIEHLINAAYQKGIYRTSSRLRL
jgi:hypothetical protein